MCQVLPFTLSCCRRVYVEVTKLPSCPDTWPEKKCPPELCIQVRGYEAEDRDAGTCWRCQAEIAGVWGDERENLRPAIDSATIVQGLDEVGVSGRRRMVEGGGNCWYCGANAGCEYCGVAINLEAGTGKEKPESSGKKRRRDARGRKKNPTNKRVKIEPRDNNQPQTPTFSSPDPENSPKWQKVFLNNMPLSPGGYRFSQGSGITGSGLPWSHPFPPQAGVPGIASLDWASVHDEQHNGQIGCETGLGLNCTSQSPDRGPQGQYPLNNALHQPQYAPDRGLALHVNSRVQPEINLENPTQMDVATLSQLFDSYKGQVSNLGHDIGQEAPEPEVPFPGNNNTDGEGAHDQQYMNAEQPLPTT